MICEYVNFVNIAAGVFICIANFTGDTDIHNVNIFTKPVFLIFINAFWTVLGSKKADFLSLLLTLLTNVNVYERKTSFCPVKNSEREHCVNIGFRDVHAMFTQ